MIVLPGRRDRRGGPAMNRRKFRRNALAACFAFSGVVVVLGASPSCGGNCEEVACSKFGGSASVTFTKCYFGAAPLETTLTDPSGDEFFDCTDPVGGTCTED